MSEVDAFLEAGEPPLVFTQSSIANEAHRYFKTSIEIAEKLRCRAIFLDSSPGTPSREHSGRHAIQFPYVPARKTPPSHESSSAPWGNRNDCSHLEGGNSSGHRADGVRSTRQQPSPVTLKGFDRSQASAISDQVCCASPQIADRIKRCLGSLPRLCGKDSPNQSTRTLLRGPGGAWRGSSLQDVDVMRAHLTDRSP